MKKPKIGDSVWFWGHNTSPDKGDSAQPAIITNIFNDYSVSIDVLDSTNKKIGQVYSVYLYQRDGKDRPLKRHCDWVQ